jgi:hypothetical protein
MVAKSRNALKSPVLTDSCSEPVYVQPREIIADPGTRPYFVLLDGLFKIKGIYRSLTSRRKVRVYNVAIVWIPIKFTDAEVGIEWMSLHGFIVHDGSLKDAVVGYTAGAEAFDNEGLSITVGKDDWDEGDFDERDSRTIDLVDVVRRRQMKLERGRARAESRRLRSEFEPQVYRVRVRRDRVLISRGGDEVSLLDQAMASDQSADSIAAAEVPLRELLGRLDNSVYQDGIPVAVNGYAIAPIGACRSKCNLTGAARFELNVSRNAINESPTVLARWAMDVGGRIQSAIVKRVTQVLRANGVDFDLDALFTPVSKEKDGLSSYTARVLQVAVFAAAKGEQDAGIDAGCAASDHEHGGSRSNAGSKTGR